MKRSVPQGVVIALIVVGFVLVAGGGYFFLVKPQRSKAAKLNAEIDQTRSAIVAARALTLQSKHPQIRVADLFRLTKAMPDQTDMAGIVLELNQVAQDSGITFDQIAPAATGIPMNGYVSYPITVDFQGNFYELSDFLYRLRNLVDVRHGALDAAGRLFAIDSIDFAQGSKGFPQITATITVDAFVFGSGAAPTGVPTPPAPTGTTGTTGASGATGPSGTTGASSASGGQ